MAEEMNRKWKIITWLQRRFMRNYNFGIEAHWKYCVLGRNGTMEGQEGLLSDDVKSSRNVLRKQFGKELIS